MRINNNIMAINTHRQLGINNANGAKSIEKLSSGYRINRAGDDAAGLAISEKMRSQIRGLTQASRNAQDDISMIQTTEGALNETHAIIHRMREMAVQSANDSNTDADREALQAEMDQLAQEVTRIANDTEFNTRKILNGNLDKNTANATGDITFHIGANKIQNMKFGVMAMDAKSLGLTEDEVTGAGTGVGIKDAKISRAEHSQSIEKLATHANKAKRKVDLTATKLKDGETAKTAAVVVGKNADGSKDVSVAIDMKVTGEKYNDINIKFVAGTGGAVSASFSKDTNTITVKLDTADGGAKNTADDITAALKAMKAEGYDFSEVTATLAGDTVIDIHDNPETLNSDGGKTKGGTDTTYTIKGTGDGGIEDSTVVKESASRVYFSGELKGLSFDTDDATKIAGSVSLEMQQSTVATFNADHSVENSAKVVNGINILTQGSADRAIETIDKALKKVSDVRAGLGAVQNRLEHTIKNVDTAAENLQASESRIRDVDMAKEMMNFTKNNILQQAAQAMLAQANQAPQGVLQLLR